MSHKNAEATGNELFGVPFRDLFDIDNKRFAYCIHKTNLMNKEEI